MTYTNKPYTDKGNSKKMMPSIFSLALEANLRKLWTAKIYFILSRIYDLVSRMYELVSCMYDLIT